MHISLRPTPKVFAAVCVNWRKDRNWQTKLLAETGRQKYLQKLADQTTCRPNYLQTKLLADQTTCRPNYLQKLADQTTCRPNYLT